MLLEAAMSSWLQARPGIGQKFENLKVAGGPHTLEKRHAPTFGGGWARSCRRAGSLAVAAAIDAVDDGHKYKGRSYAGALFQSRIS